MTEIFMFTIYDKPRDFPNHFVVRGWTIDGNEPKPSPDCKLFDTLEDARGAIPAWMVCLNREPSDDANIVESYI